MQRKQGGSSKRARSDRFTYRTRPASLVNDGMLRSRPAYRRVYQRRPEIKSQVISGLSPPWGLTQDFITPLALLPDIANGSEETERIGSKINCKWIDLKLDLDITSYPDVPAEGCTVTMDIWLDKLGNIPSTAQMYDVPSAGNRAFPNPLFYTKYKLLKRFECVISPTATNTSGDVTSVSMKGHYDVRIPVNCVLEYDGASSRPAHNRGVWITACTSETATGNFVQMDLRARTYFSDQ